jgi:hypothetical protein
VESNDNSSSSSEASSRNWNNPSDHENIRAESSSKRLENRRGGIHNQVLKRKLENNNNDGSSESKEGGRKKRNPFGGQLHQRNEDKNSSPDSSLLGDGRDDDENSSFRQEKKRIQAVIQKAKTDKENAQRAVRENERLQKQSEQKLADLEHLNRLNNHPILRCSYKALRVIGRGTFGTVALCECNTSGRPVAVKSFKKVDSMEALVLQKLKGHPNIAKHLFDIKVGNQQHIVLEYLSGGNVFTLLKEVGPLSEKFSANLAVQLVAGLKHMHDEGFAHLDLKPSNLLLRNPLPDRFKQRYNAKESKFDDVITRDFAEVKICDFGLATQKNRMRGGFGSFHYMAPEILVSLL